MMKSTITILIFTIMLSGFLHAQNQDWNITGAGARAEGMGGAFIGVADDATSVVWNPAGLATLQRPEASLVTRYITNSYEWSEGDNQGDTFEQDHIVLNFISGAIPLEFMDRNLVAALAFQKQLDFYAYDTQVYDYDAQGNAIEGDIYESSGGANTLSPGLGFQLTPMISAGLAANLWFGSWEDEYNEYGPGYSESITFEQEFSGLNFGVGVLADLSQLSSPLPLKLGLSFKSPFNLDITSTSAELSEEYTLSINMPTMFGAGASYRLGEFFTLAADFEYRGYSISEVTEDDSNESEYLSDAEEDIVQFRLGMEYLLVTDWVVMPFRAGFRNVPTLLADYNSNGDPLGQVVGFGFTAGTGIILENLALDFTYSYSEYEAVDGSFTDLYYDDIITLSAIYYMGD